MRFDVVTLFRAMVDGPLSESIVGRSRKQGILELGFVDPRDFTTDRHRSVDDRPYGGGPGMVMLAEPLYQAIASVKREDSLVVMLGPKGERFTQNTARTLSGRPHVILLCGHYEGVDARIDRYVDMELSLGDFIMTGGEPAAVAVIDATTRLLPGVFVKDNVPDTESFSGNLLEAPHYTRPAVWRGMSVPDVLLGGNHGEVDKWRDQESLALTRSRRPDLLKTMLEDNNATRTGRN
ncbi:MAG: tRNA (guanosine(37)-N1)-methyltransferase TrmD [Elusimicrobiaceae bacterium]|nr:tRNA (guanosine(37)-N1)-methyltransferase TrmD [Elusimicrobiaceae bacterium]